MADRQLIRPLGVAALEGEYARAEPFPFERLQRQVASALQTAKRCVRRLVGRAIGRR